MVNIARTTPTITPMMNHSIIVLLHGQGWFFSHGSRIFLSAQKREEFIPFSSYGAGWVSGQGGGGTPSKRENGGATRGRRDRRYLPLCVFVRLVYGCLLYKKYTVGVDRHGVPYFWDLFSPEYSGPAERRLPLQGETIIKRATPGRPLLSFVRQA